MALHLTMLHWLATKLVILRLGKGNKQDVRTEAVVTDREHQVTSSTVL